jgi:hypothetical protein
MKEKMKGWLALDRSTLDYVGSRLGRAPNCSIISNMHRFEWDMDRWLERLDEKKSVY